jgi:hypothetical protein
VSDPCFDSRPEPERCGWCRKAVVRGLLATLLVAGVVCAVSTDVARAAAPRIVIVSGPLLDRRVVISNWQRIFGVVDEIARARPVARVRLGARPRLRLSLFWGPRWNDYLSKGGSPRALRPEQADQFGSFYPAWRGRSALIDLPWAGRWPRLVPERALTILRRYGVPVRVP